MSTKVLGTFQVTSGKVYVSDPCYEPDFAKKNILANVKNGTWSAKVEIHDPSGRCAKLLVCHEQFKSAPKKFYKKCGFDVDVDSGQAGIFDVSVYQNDETVEGRVSFMPEEPWYSRCCEITMGSGAGVIPGGAVSNSGFGDGTYKAYRAMDETGEIIAIYINFGD